MTIKEKKKLRNILMLYCGGSRYHNNISVDEKLQMKKEQHHAENIIYKLNEKIDLGNLYKKKIGFKAIVYNFDNNTKVKLESFVDIKNEAKKGSYVKLYEKIDDGKWELIMEKQK
jgi:hypothetical protein